jgi:gamma-glutamyltranspeptidase / glutathione hydrolase
LATAYFRKRTPPMSTMQFRRLEASKFRKTDRDEKIMRKVALIVTAMLGVAAAPPGPSLKDQGDRYSGAPWASRSAVLGVNGMAATSHPLVTQIAIDVLKKGGTAVDAAIAADAALGLMEPTGSGIGGDMFVIVWDPKTRKLHGLNASGRAPMGQTLEQLTKANKNRPELPAHSWRSVTIPGVVDGWFALHGRFGRLPMKDILLPAIRYAEEGFPLTEYIAKALATNVAGFEKSFKAGELEEIGNMRRVYAPSGHVPKEGEIFSNRDLARTYRIIAAGGRDAFYSGPLTDAMDAYFKKIGAPHRKSDFQQHHSDWVEPVSTNYRGYDVWELPPNGQGVIALEMLNILERFDLASMGRASPDFWHVMVEAKKLAFEDRATYLAEGATYKFLLDKDWAAKRAKTIDMMRAARELSPGQTGDTQRDTVYLTIADHSGMMVSLIQSNYRGVGSGLVPSSLDERTLGFTLQDRGQQFALDPKHPNAYAPGKRPFHTIIPAFVTKDGKPWLSFGVMGGDMQPQGHAQILVNMIDFGMGLQPAGDAARFHHDGSTEPLGLPPMNDGGIVQLETGVPQAVAHELVRRGHKIAYAPGTGVFGGYQAILRDPTTGVYWGASEFRKDGLASGY